MRLRAGSTKRQCSKPRRSTTLDPLETREWLESIDSVLQTCTARSARTTCSSGSSTTRAAPAPTCRSSRTPPTSTRSRPGQEHEYPGDRALERRHRGVPALERDGDGRAGEPAELRVRRPHRDLRLGGDALRSRLQSLLARAGRAASGRHGLHPGPLVARHLCARLSRRPADRGPAAPLPRGGRRRRACRPIRIPG